MNALVSLCNKAYSPDPNGDVFLLKVDVIEQRATPIRFPEELSKTMTGITGLCRFGDGLACVLSPVRLMLLSAEFDVRAVHTLTHMQDGHSICARGHELYLVSSGTDSIVRFSEADGESVFWRAADTNADTLHMNSLLWHEGELWFSAFGPKSGQLWTSALDGFVQGVNSGRTPITRIYHPHSLAVSDQGFWILESSQMIIHGPNGLRFPAPLGYLRGLAVQGRHVLVGSTVGRCRSKSQGVLLAHAEDPGQKSGECGLAIFEVEDGGRSLSQVGFVDLSEYGTEIYDVCLL